MILRDLIISNPWLSVELIFIRLYPDQGSSLNGYERVFNELKTLPPVKSEITILISNEIDSFDNDSYVNVGGNLMIINTVAALKLINKYFDK